MDLKVRIFKKKKSATSCGTLWLQAFSAIGQPYINIPVVRLTAFSIKPCGSQPKIRRETLKPNSIA
jgi:hypothetical protein